MERAASAASSPETAAVFQVSRGSNPEEDGVFSKACPARAWCGAICGYATGIAQRKRAANQAKRIVFIALRILSNQQPALFNFRRQCHVPPIFSGLENENFAISEEAR